MKIIICSHDGKNYFGGPYEWIKRLGPSFRDKGIEVIFLFFTDHKIEESSTYLYLKELGFKCDALKLSSLSQYNDNTEYRIKWIIEKVRYYKADAVIANNLPFALYSGKWLIPNGIPVIGVLHTDDIRQEWLLEEFIGGQPEHALSGLVCVSNHLKTKALPYNKYDIPIRVISCGTPVPSTSAQYNTNLKLVYAGKLTEQAKQISKVVHSMGTAIRGKTNAEAVIYGDGEKKAEVIKLVEQYKNLSSIKYGGFIPLKEIQDRLLENNVLVLLSDYEGLPIILIEAMACGLVPICTNIQSGIPELVQHMQTGIIVNNREEEFNSAVNLLLEDKELWKRLSTNAREKAIRTHSLESTTKDWYDLLATLRAQNPKKEINTPKKITLPPVNQKLTNIDKRKKNIGSYILQQVTRITNRLKVN